MKRHVSRITFVLTLMGILSIAGPVDAATPVPFNGSLQGNVAITPQDPPFVSLLIEGSALLNHLGQFTFSIPHTVNFATATGSGEYVFTSVMGDTLRANFTGNATPTAANPNNLDIVEIATITGGTGRFAGASGSFTSERFFDTLTLTTVGTFEGTIVVPEPAGLILCVIGALGLLGYGQRSRKRICEHCRE